jgi:hypothetical protein
MSKHRVRQIHSHSFQALALTLVDSHRKNYADGKLASTDCKWKGYAWWCHDDARYEHSIADVSSGYDFGFQNTLSKLFNNESGSIA